MARNPLHYVSRFRAVVSASKFTFPLSVTKYFCLEELAGVSWFRVSAGLLMLVTEGSFAMRVLLLETE